MHDLVVGLFITRYEFGYACVKALSTKLKTSPSVLPTGRDRQPAPRARLADRLRHHGPLN